MAAVRVPGSSDDLESGYRVLSSVKCIEKQLCVNQLISLPPQKQTNKENLEKGFPGKRETWEYFQLFGDQQKGKRIPISKLGFLSEKKKTKNQTNKKQTTKKTTNKQKKTPQPAGGSVGLRIGLPQVTASSAPNFSLLVSEKDVASPNFISPSLLSFYDFMVSLLSS